MNCLAVSFRWLQNQGESSCLDERKMMPESHEKMANSESCPSETVSPIPVLTSAAHILRDPPRSLTVLKGGTFGRYMDYGGLQLICN